MKNRLTAIILLFSISAFSQTIEKSSISSGGASTSNGTLTMVYSIGEVNVAETTSANIHISEGFISKGLNASLGIKEITKIQGVKVYPNPTVDKVNLSFTEVINAEVRVFDLTGRAILSKHFNDVKTSIDLSRYNIGTYLLHVYDLDNARVITYKIIKK
ncbi:MAG: T9SS type A sorting domain-containing protein [Flavobacteriaceae bacterium]|nr:T9SS type A sorting domain-containing protein [Flavobacteriaceae bacterium]